MPTPLAHDDPATLGPYRLVARLGSGGMGTVYMARGVGGRTVALKTMHARIATDPGIRTRFRLEVDAARVMGDRFGARVVDADPFAETPWLATEFVLGPALDEAVLGTGPLPERSVRPPRAWKRGRLADSIKERETGAARMTTDATAQLPDERRALTRRRLLTGLSTTGVVVAAGGGTTAWLLGTTGGGTSGGGTKSSPFAVPPAVATPAQNMTVVDDKVSGSPGRPGTLWTLENAADVYSPYLLPVWDVLVLGAANGGIVAYGVKDGRRRWSAPRVVTKSGYLSLSDRLVVGTDSRGALRTYVPSTGEAKWTCPAAEAAQLLGADAESVYVITKDDRLRSVRRADAKVGWTATVPADFRKKVFAPAAVGPGRLVMGTTDGNFLAVDTSNGRMAWNRLDHVPIGLRPAVRGDTVCLGGYTLEAVRIADGERIWSVKPHGDLYRERWGPVTVSGSRLYATEGIYPRRLDPRDGSQLWSGYSESAGTALYAGRALPQGHAVWSIDKSVVRTEPMELDAAKAVDGGRLWRYEFPRTDYTRLAADGNRVFLMHDSKVVALTTF